MLVVYAGCGTSGGRIWVVELNTLDRPPSPLDPPLHWGKPFVRKASAVRRWMCCMTAIMPSLPPEAVGHDARMFADPVRSLLRVSLPK